MRKRNTVLILGILAFAIMIIAQVIIIRGGWKQVDEMLYLRYRSLSQEANSSLRGSRSMVFDTVSYLLDYYTESVVLELPLITDDQQLQNKKDEILKYFTTVLNKEQDLSTYLLEYFESQGAENEFNHRIVITNLEILSNDTLVIFRDPSFRERRPSRDIEGLAHSLKGSTSTILVTRPWFDRNNYILNFNYYIDFTFKRSMILRELSASLGMSIFSILIMVMIFLYTYRNLVEEKRLSDLKTDFINNMTHELKTPLATITVAGKTLEMEKIRTDESKILDTAKLIGKQSIHLNQLINMILEISMWERTEFQLDKKKVDVEEIMNDIVSSFRTGCGDCTSLKEKYTFNEAKADIDLVYFTTLINNLLSNAVKYSEREPVINIEGRAENNNISIRIADNGIGISRSDQKHVFDKFYRASSGNIHKYKGLGLGLYYVKKIATAHGGDVTVTSKPGKGSIFTVTIPF